MVSPTDQHDDRSPCTKMWFMHFASLMEGGKLAWLDPVNKENSFVQNGVARGLPRCKVYRHDTPDFIVTDLVGLGNDTNADAAETNHLQTYTASETAECSWNRKKRQETWTIENLGQGTHENLKIEHVNSIFGGSSATARRWQVIGHYERCWGSFRDSQKVKGASGKTLCAAYDEWCMACDFKKLQASTDKNYIARLFRNNFVTMASIGWTHPDLALEVLKCFVPRRKEFRDLSLLKGGLSVVKTIEEHQLFGLLAPVNNSKDLEHASILHSVVAIGRMTHKSDRGIISYLPDFIHNIFQEMCDEAAKLRCGAARALAPIVELHEASRIPIVEFYSGFVVGELQECMASSR